MVVCGQEFTPELLGRISGLLLEQPQLSRRALSLRVCEWLNWRAPDGRLKQMSCRVSLCKLPELNSFDDREEKVVNIGLHIGRRPIFAFGNSDGDQQMLEYTAASTDPHLALLVHHDDADREFAYDRQSKIGRLDKAWDEAIAKGWVVVSMKSDWNTIYPGPAR